MRLLQREPGEHFSLTPNFLRDSPPYAILSHTWGDDDQEVTFQDIQHGTGMRRDGYKKLEFCGKQSSLDGLHHFWIDTCCIDKTNSTELNEAINSMFRWYQGAAVCYVYLHDVSCVLDLEEEDPSRSSWMAAFRRSRWFTRGWTLQELIAPASVTFFSANGQRLGDKKSLEGLLHDITGIPIDALRGQPLSAFSVDGRFSWLGARATKREEDRAYSMLGIFGVHLPMIYGEGEWNAFRRLREEIDKHLQWRLEVPDRTPMLTNNLIGSREKPSNSSSMGAIEPSVSMAGLVEVFNDCVDIVENIDPRNDFGIDSRAIISRFDKDKLLFQKWGQTIGLKGKSRRAGYHEKLDPVVVSEFREILVSIREIAAISGGISSAQQGFSFARPQSQTATPQRLPFERPRRVTSRKNQVGWTWRQKAQFVPLSQQFGWLVERLCALVPPESTNDMALPVRRTRTGLDLAVDKSYYDRDRQVGNGSNLDIELILMIEKQTEHEMRREVNAWLHAPHSDTIYEDSMQKKLAGTCDWILDREAFQIWKSLEFPSNTAKLLWITGPAGYGKTVLTANIINHLKDQGALPVASFFFSADLEDRADPFIVVRSWVSQLLSQSRDAFELACDRQEIQTGKTASQREVLELLREVLQKLPQCILIVDGLDECTSKRSWSTQHNRSLSSFIRAVTQTVAGTTSRILLVSREDLDIRDELSDLATRPVRLEFSEYKIIPRDVQLDATLLSQSIVNQKLRNKSQAVRDEIASRMVDRSDSMLLRIRLIENDLRGGKNQRQLEKIVEEAPAELGGLYDRSWERIMDQREVDRNRALSILRWATFAQRSVTISEITEALLAASDDIENALEDEFPDEIDEDFVKTEILDLCYSLVETRPTGSAQDVGSRTLHLAHFTVREYILQRDPISGAGLRANEKLRSQNDAVQNNIIAEACLRYLKVRWIWKDSQQTISSHRVLGSFRDYAASFWYRHVRKDCPRYESVSRMLIEFFCSDNSGWENWRTQFDQAETTLQMVQYTGEIISTNRMFYAAYLGFADLVQHLIEKRCLDANRVDESRRTTLLASAVQGNLELLGYLLEKRADIDLPSTEGRTPLYVAASTGHIEVAKLLVEKGADWTAADNDGWTPLNAASSGGHVEVVNLLLEKGADFTVANSKGWTPLSFASSSGHVEVVKLLLEKGADLALPNHRGQSALHLAAERGKIDVVKLLIFHGADIRIEDHLRRSPIFYAIQSGDYECLSLMVYENMDTNIVDCYGSTPLSVAARYGYQKIVECLLKSSNVDVSLADHFGRSPVWWAQKQGHNTITELLQLHIGNENLEKDASKDAMGEPADFGSQGIFCDVCFANTGIACFFCACCSKGDFDICMECKRLGAHCLDESHSLLLLDSM